MRVGREIQVQHETKFQITKQSVAPDSFISVNWGNKKGKKIQRRTLSKRERRDSLWV